MALMPQDIKELLNQIAHHEAMTEHHSSMAASLRAQYQTILGSTSVDWGNGLLKRRPTKSHGRWVAWLKENGPATRKTIADTAGLLTGEVPPYADTLGLSASQLEDASYPDDTMMRLSAENEHGHGRPVDVYFLWSQRYDVHPLFRVGPIKPDPNAMDTSVTEQATVLSQPVSEAAPEPDTASETTRFATLEEWDTAWSATFDGLAATEGKPSAEVRQQMVDSLPDGADGNAAIAIAYREATVRCRAIPPFLGLLGEVPPPEPEPEPDRSGWTMVGNHNHLPHPWCEFCAISHCVRLEEPQTLLGVIHPPEETQSNEIPLDWDHEEI